MGRWFIPIGIDLGVRYARPEKGLNVGRDRKFALESLLPLGPPDSVDALETASSTGAFLAPR
jgi:hypothetical protein